MNFVVNVVVIVVSNVIVIAVVNAAAIVAFEIAVLAVEDAVPKIGFLELKLLPELFHLYSH